jgi:methyltransferase (TIGR00027 family)
MKKGKSSKTAEGIALIRAIEASKPKAQRISYDPFARSFVHPLSYFISKWIVSTGIYEKIGKGAFAFITARERYIDDYLIHCLKEGFEQIVILGAGYDTRAYRIKGIEKTKVFEVDHPATQMMKRKKLRKVIHPLPDHVTFVPVDFDTQVLSEQLFHNGYQKDKKTLFIWQGVTVYLKPEGIENTLSFMTKHATSGSAVIFDYYYKETLEDTNRTDVRNMQRTAKITGENYLFGVEEGKIETFLKDRGFENIHDASSHELKQRYFTGANSHRTVAQGLAIVSANIASR